jgi:peptide/nickel transport system substrate-binding protein
VQKAPVLASSIIFVMIFSAFAVVSPAFAQSEKGAYIDQARFIERSDENLALEEVKSGGFDAYYFRIPLEVADDAKDDSRLKTYERTAGSAGLLLNPAPAKGDSINPFQFREVRFAMNYLVDREFVVNEILKGYGNPMIEPFGVYSPEYLNVLDVVESFGFRHNPNLAEDMISDALTAAGATKEDGKWTFNGNLITIKILIRLDDTARKSMGEDLASRLEGIGITVQKEYGDLNKANSVVYGSDPQDFQWHIYTEGFAGTSVFVRYNPLTVGQMYGPWYGALPGAQNPSFWQYQNATIDEVTQRIFFFNFTSEAERNELVRTAVRAGVQESVRIFLVQKTEPFVTSSSLQGMVNDFGAGITSKYSLLNARPAESNSLDIGVKLIHQGAWNGIGGLNDAYSRDIYYSLIDTATFRDPYTGEIIPVRAEWTDISTEGPAGALEVAQDAQTWDPETQQWKDAGPNARATSKVAFNLLYSNWHHGVPMGVADLLYTQYFIFEWGTDLGEGDLTKDPEFTSQQQQAIPLIKGIRFTAPNVIESYVDQWHYDEKEIADSAAYWSTEPWEITAATERLVTGGKAAYSRSEATARNVPQLDLIIPPHAQMVKEELEKMKSENFVPPALQEIVSLEDAIGRYDASIQWIQDHDHAIISNGAFYLDSYNIAGRTITVKAFRDSTYPFEVGHFSTYETARLADISRVNTMPITIGSPATLTVNVQVDGQLSNDATVDYFILDKDGNVAARGQGEPAAGSTGEFRIELSERETSKLSAGPNQLRIFANSVYAFRPDISENTILATSASGVQATPDEASTEQEQTAQQPSGCLVATAAFGSELTPQVQYLRDFREHYILSTVSGSAFMGAFNSVYYSFSPHVADYERDQPWLQAVVKTGLYPLFGILNVAERAHFAASGGEPGALASGATASMLIGAVYLWPAALSKRLQSRFGIIAKGSLVIVSAAAALTAIGIAAGSAELLSIATPLFVLSIATASAMAIGRLARKAYGAIRTAADINRK